LFVTHGLAAGDRCDLLDIREEHLRIFQSYAYGEDEIAGWGRESPEVVVLMDCADGREAAGGAVEVNRARPTCYMPCPHGLGVAVSFRSADFLLSARLLSSV
jgi:hypothetical protein